MGLNYLSLKSRRWLLFGSTFGLIILTNYLLFQTWYSPRLEALKETIEGLEAEIASLEEKSKSESLEEAGEVSDVAITPQERARDLIEKVRWICYTPTQFIPGTGPHPSDSSVRDDLVNLKKHGFRGLITYGADVDAIPRIATEEQFEIMLGIWDPTSPGEIEAALSQAKSSPSVKAIIVGNEGLMTRRYQLDQLTEAMDRVRSADLGVLVSTTETVDEIKKNPVLIELSDFVTANAHPYWYDIKEPEAAVAWTVSAHEEVARLAGDKPVLLKEVGLPTGGDPAVSEAAQKAYYEALMKEPVSFAWFEAYDMPWKTHQPVEPHWGLFLLDRTPKAIAKYLQEESRGPIQPN